ncbi:hypothetical protein KEM60_01453 [Austwickia sp. TVS 96-490-7B]|uniref:lipopolysaccharide biosynthesis protein n=1 Tax=Austwickia sp. TVS 96-490-7B TaxID=2830843 RepID=UPI001C59206C|nr:hypothetical protein [Austwickia sp. TVS 96-490-7B]MBW3085256.1 hypothetical protein [Austwickia sp. TVS 96-490-7B]
MSERGGMVATGALTLGAAIVGAVANFAIAVVVGRSYGAADTGVFFAVIGAFLVAGSALRCGADTGLTRSMSRLRALDRQADLVPTAVVAVVPVAVAGLLVAVTVWAVSGRVGAALGGADSVAPDLVHDVALFVPLLSLLTVVTAGTRGLGRVAPYALLQHVALPMTRLAGVGAAAALGAGIVVAAGWWAWGLPVVTTAAAVIFVREIRRAAPPGPPSWDRWRELAVEFWTFSLPRAVCAIVEIVLEWLDVMWVAVLAGQEAAGIYAVATRLVKVALIVDQAVRVTMSTRISAWLAVGEVAKVQRLYEVGTTAMVSLVWPFVIVLGCFPDTAMGMFGKDFPAGSALLLVLCVGMAVLAAAGSIQSILLLGGLSSRQLVNKSVALVTFVSLGMVLIPRWGALGGALTWAGTVLVDTALAAWAVQTRIGVRLTTRVAARVGPTVVLCVAPVAVAIRFTVGNNLAGMATAALLGLLVLAVVMRRDVRDGLFEMR